MSGTRSHDALYFATAEQAEGYRRNAEVVRMSRRDARNMVFCGKQCQCRADRAWYAHLAWTHHAHARRRLAMALSYVVA